MNNEICCGRTKYADTIRTVYNQNSFPRSIKIDIDNNIYNSAEESLKYYKCTVPNLWRDKVYEHYVSEGFMVTIEEANSLLTTFKFEW